MKKQVRIDSAGRGTKKVMKLIRQGKQWVAKLPQDRSSKDSALAHLNGVLKKAGIPVEFYWLIDGDEWEMRAEYRTWGALIGAGVGVIIAVYSGNWYAIPECAILGGTIGEYLSGLKFRWVESDGCIKIQFSPT